MEEINAKKRARARDELDESPELDADIPEVKRLRESLLENLDDDSEICTTSQDLVLFMKTFEEEIMNSPAKAVGPKDLRLDSDEPQPALGYLLEASDDDLGIPPTLSSPVGRTELDETEPDSLGLGAEFWQFAGEENSSFNSFGFVDAEGYGGAYAGLDGFYDYSDTVFGSGDSPWRSETLPAQ